ncbi:MAG: DUF368 domain-containing protein [Acidobacteriota bacterium]
MSSSDTARGPKDYVYLVFTGIVMGAADVVPGVSGGTMAFIMGVYQELLDAIRSVDLKVARLALRLRIREILEVVPWKFLLALGSGILAAGLTLAGVVSWLLEHQPVYLYSLFFGLVLASVVAIGTQVRWSTGAVLTMLFGTALAWWIVGLVPLQMPHDPLTVFLSASVTITAMILPGISGSLILLILGQYEYILNAVKSLDIVTLIPFVLGLIVGLASFARVLGWLLRTYRQRTITLLVGFMIGSLRKIWPFKETLETMVDRHGEVVPLLERNVAPELGPTLWLCIGLSVLGFVLIRFLTLLQASRPGFAAGETDG